MSFEGFKLERMSTGEAVLRFRQGGSGPPLLLLHGYPQTHMMWGQIAGELARATGTQLYIDAYGVARVTPIIDTLTAELGRRYRTGSLG